MFELIAALVGGGVAANNAEQARKAGSKALGVLQQQQYAAGQTRTAILKMGVIGVGAFAFTFAVVRLVKHGK
jgi:hypothetical protein